MAIKPFNLLNKDGTTNQSEYNRCIKFLQDYIAGDVNVYPPIAWANPYEIDMSQQKSSMEILRDCLNYESNKLFTPVAWENFKNIFTGILERYGSTIHTCGNYLECSADFYDGPGYMYDVFTDPKEDQTKVIKSQLNDDITIYYLDDEKHTVLEYNDSEYNAESSINDHPITNFPSLDIYPQRYLISNVTDYPGVYKGYLSGVYSDFQRLAGQYIGSSTLFYYSECNDDLYTSGLYNHTDDRINEYMQFTATGYQYLHVTPTRGIDLDRVTMSQNAVTDEGQSNAYITPEVFNPEISYISPTQLTAGDIEEWYI